MAGFSSLIVPFGRSEFVRNFVLLYQCGLDCFLLFLQMRMQVKSIEEHVRASAEYKLGVANQSITAGFFDDNTRLGYESIDFLHLL